MNKRDKVFLRNLFWHRWMFWHLVFSMREWLYSDHAPFKVTGKHNIKDRNGSSLFQKSQKEDWSSRTWPSPMQLSFPLTLHWIVDERERERDTKHMVVMLVTKYGQSGSTAHLLGRAHDIGESGAGSPLWAQSCPGGLNIQWIYH